MRRAGGTLIDSGPLFGLLVTRLETRRGGNLWPEETWPPFAERAFLRFLARPGGLPVVLPPGTLVEVHHLARARRRAGASEAESIRLFWGFARDELLRLGLGERVVRVIDLPLHRLQTFGPVDTALFHLAERRRRAVLVTADARLVDAFRAAGLAALSLEEAFARSG